MDMALPLNSESKRLDKGGNEANYDAPGDCKLSVDIANEGIHGLVGGNKRVVGKVDFAVYEPRLTRIVTPFAESPLLAFSGLVASISTSPPLLCACHYVSLQNLCLRNAACTADL